MGVELSIISPVYRGKSLVEPLIQELNSALGGASKTFEIILVEDGCPENSWTEISRVAKMDSNIVGVKLSRNFGQHHAISAGLSIAKGEYVVVVDCDLQDDPSEILAMLNKSKKNADSIVLARRMNRKDGVLKRITSRWFHNILSFLSGLSLDPRVGNFGVYPKASIEAVLSMKDSIRYFPTMISWVGFQKIYHDIEHRSRFEGKSSYSFKRLLNLALDIILSYSDKPIRTVIYLGLGVSIASFGIAVYYFIGALSGLFEVTGFASIMVSIWFLSGMILFSMGVIGLYVGKAFEAAKGRPSFIIESLINND